MRNNRKAFTLIELLIVVVIVGILALAAIPLITSNTRDARRAEGTQLLASARDAARVEYSRTGSAPAAFSGFLSISSFAGEYFVLRDGIHDDSGAGKIAVSSKTESVTDGTGVCVFQWASGESDISFS